MRWMVAGLVLLAGCSGPVAKDVDEPVVAPEPATSALTGAVEPAGLRAPLFRLLGSIASGGPAYGAGEPSIWASLDGVVYVAFPGCDRSFYLAGPVAPGDEDCGNGLVFESLDEGATWTRLNRDGDGLYMAGGPAANNDADVAVDAAGNLYVSNLGGGGIQFHTRWANGTWEHMANIVPRTESTSDDPDAREGSDRQWLAAAGEGHVINTWMRTSPQRDVAINTTFDGGRTWTGRANFGDGIGWLGTVQFAPDGMGAYIPYTQPLSAGAVPLASGPSECAMRVIATADGGRTWDDVDTGARWTTSQTGGHWSCVHMAPALDVTGDGTVVVAWSQDSFIPEDSAPYNAMSASSHLYVMASRDQGRTWSAPEIYYNEGLLSGFGQRIMPWVTGGAGDRFAITYLYNPVPADQDYTGALWDVRVAVMTGIGTSNWTAVDSVIESGVHAGGICTRGGTCLLTGSDRAFLDFFEADVMPDGRLVVTYPHDLNASKMIEIRVAIQDGGTPLLERP